MSHKPLVLLILLILIVSPGILAQVYIVEGFSSMHLVSDRLAQRALNSLQRRNPQATIDDARMAIARRQASMDAMRNMAEYMNGIKFEFRGNKFHRKLVAGSKGMFRWGRYSYRVLPSGIVVATRRIELKEEIKKKRMHSLKIYQVTGVCQKPQANILMTMRHARMDAVSKAVAMAIQEQAPQNKDGAYQGTVYIVCTKKDNTAKDYQVTMELQVEFNN